MNQRNSLDDVNKILVIGPSWVGDMVMSQSLYKCLHKLYPNIRIDVLAPGWCKPILDRMPEVDTAIEMPIGHGELNISSRWKLGRSLKPENYDVAITLPNSAKSALIPLFAGIKRRTGWKGEFRYGLLNDLRPDRKVFQYMVERYVALAYSKSTMLENTSLATIDKPSLTIDLQAQKESISRLGLSLNAPVIGFCPGAEFGPAKRWPDKYYTETALELIKRGYQIWIFGSIKDNEIAERIVKNIPEEFRAHCKNLAGKTTLIEVVDLIAACDTVLSNDSGLMHIAAAVNCNIIAIYGSSSPMYTPPLADKVKVVNTNINCRPCFKRTCPLNHQDCLNKLYPKQILQAFDELSNSSA